MSDIVQRLRRKTVAGQPVFPTPLDIDAANEIERLRARVGRDVGDFDYPPGSAPCMCFFSTAEDRGPDPLGECDYHKALRARLAECERLRDIISPGDAAAYEEGMAALLARCEAVEARLAEAERLLRAWDEIDYEECEFGDYAAVAIDQHEFDAAREGLDDFLRPDGVDQLHSDDAAVDHFAAAMREPPR